MVMPVNVPIANNSNNLFIVSPQYEPCSVHDHRVVKQSCGMKDKQPEKIANVVENHTMKILFYLKNSLRPTIN